MVCNSNDFKSGRSRASAEYCKILSYNHEFKYYSRLSSTAGLDTDRKITSKLSEEKAFSVSIRLPY